MKNNSKNLSHKIRSIEDAIGFDNDDYAINYERIGTSKKQIIDDLELLEKKKFKGKDQRRTDVYFSDDF